MARYDLEKARRELDRDRFRQRLPGMWRWREILPVFDEQKHDLLRRRGCAVASLTPAG